MIKQILRKLGYIHEDILTEKFLAGRLAAFLGDATDNSLSKELEENFFSDLAKIDNATKYLRATASTDMQKHFGAADQKQADLIHGAFARTMYWASMVERQRKPKEEVKEKSKIKGLRYR